MTLQKKYVRYVPNWKRWAANKRGPSHQQHPVSQFHKQQRQCREEP